MRVNVNMGLQHDLKISPDVAQFTAVHMQCTGLRMKAGKQAGRQVHGKSNRPDDDM